MKLRPAGFGREVGGGTAKLSVSLAVGLLLTCLLTGHDSEDMVN
jgi:hypothetical protein